MYSQAIAGAEGDATLFGNRSAAHLGAGLYQDAIVDAQKATALAPAWAKGWYRRVAPVPPVCGIYVQMSWCCRHGPRCSLTRPGLGE